MTTLTCEHCESEIDIAKDPRCVVYDPSGATDVMCEKCKKLEFDRMIDRLDDAYRIKRGWRA